MYACTPAPFAVLGRPAILVTRGIEDLDPLHVATAWAYLVDALAAPRAPRAWSENDAANNAALDTLARLVARSKDASREHDRWIAVLRVALARWSIHGLAAGCALVSDLGGPLGAVRDATRAVRDAHASASLELLVQRTRDAYTITLDAMDEVYRARAESIEPVDFALAGAIGNLSAARWNMDLWTAGNYVDVVARLLADTLRFWWASWELVGYARSSDSATLANGFRAGVVLDIVGLVRADLGR